jgi:hypothetical protein
MARLGMLGPRPVGWPRITKALRHPGARVRRRRFRRRSTQVLLAVAREELEHALRAWSRDDSAAPEVICLKGPDYLVAQPYLEAGRLRAVPGGIGWLGDRWASLQPAERLSGGVGLTEDRSAG